MEMKALIYKHTFEIKLFGLLVLFKIMLFVTMGAIYNNKSISLRESKIYDHLNLEKC